MRYVVFLSVVCVAGLVAGCERKPPAGTAAVRPKNQNILLITLDTTRADHLGCYGYKPALTPTLDGLASRGVLFEHAYSQVPMTLPSHCSIMTGKYPRALGVRNNGREILPAGTQTLAVIAKQHGYRTGAFIASFVLDPSFGLNQGFDTYDADLGDVPPDANLLTLERRADAVTDRALPWLQSPAKEPFFCWIHYYDPHDPYDPPAAFREQCPDPYDGEIAFMDSQLRRVIEWLGSSGRASDTLVVVVGDHGEAFSEHGETGHVMFLYDANIHVPMILSEPGVVPEGRRVSTNVELVDVFATVLDLMGWPPAAGVGSRSLVPALDGQLDARDCIAESLYAFDAFGWAEQRGIITEQWKYISSTRPELFDRAADPRELASVAAQHPDVCQRLHDLLLEQYESTQPGQAQAAELTGAARQALESLGYVGGAGARGSEQFLTPGLPDPKDVLQVATDLKDARELIRRGRAPEGVALLRRAAVRSPESRLVHYNLGIGLLESGHLDEGIAELNAALRIDPGYAEALVGLGDAMRNTGKFDKAVEYYRAAIALGDKLAETHARLGMALQAGGHPDEALAAFKEALSRSPTYVDVYLQIATLLLNRKDFAEGIRNLREAVRIKPAFGAAWIQLGLALAQQGQLADAKNCLDKAAELPASAAEAHFHLGALAFSQGNPVDAIAHYERSLTLAPTPQAAEALTGIYLGQRRETDAVRVLRIGAQAAPNDPRLANSLAWILATTPNDQLRDGATALTLARRAAELTRQQNPTALRTLAAALAETGDFAQATQTARRALELAESSQQKELAAAVRAQLDLYAAGKPYRASP